MIQNKPRVIKDYEKLDPEIQERIKLEYPSGYSDNLIYFNNKEGKRVSALPFETDDKYYLVRMTVEPEEADSAETVYRLRGVTPEFYRPVRQALREALRSEEQIRKMMTEAGLERVRFSDGDPFWCAVGYKS